MAGSIVKKNIVQWARKIGNYFNLQNAETFEFRKINVAYANCTVHSAYLYAKYSLRHYWLILIETVRFSSLSMILGCSLLSISSASLACSQQSKCVSLANTLPSALLRQLKKDLQQNLINTNKPLGVAQNTTAEEELERYFDVVFFDLNNDYRTDALVRLKPLGQDDETNYPMCFYQHVGSDDEPVFEQVFTLGNARLPIIILAQSTNGWNDIVMNANDPKEQFAGILMQYDGERYLRLPNTFLGTVMVGRK